MPNFSADDVIVGEGNLLYAPLGTALPDETTVGYGAYDSWTSWIHFGYTTEPITFNYSYDEFSVEVQQSLAPIKRRKTTESMVISTTLAQFTGDILALVTGGTNTDTAAGASQKGFSRVTTGGSSNIAEYMVAVEGYRIDDVGTQQPVRVFLYKATITASGDMPFDKAGVTGLPVTITGLTDPDRAVGSNLYEAQIVTAPATS
jgi:hypothetical protein